MHMKKAIHTIRPIIQFAQKNMMYIFFFVLPMIIWHVPSFDRMEETHGFLYADGILRGNGILVGTKVDGVDRVAFLTCKHVVTTPYLPANVAYINGARDSYGLYLNSPGKAFQYICLSNINPRRWHLAKDDDADFAWIVLSDDEIQKISGPKGPAYVQLQKSIMSKNEGMLCLRDFLLAGVQEGSEVENTRLFSRVSGNQFDPISCRYFSLVAKIPFAEKILRWLFKSGELCFAWGTISRCTITAPEKSVGVSLHSTLAAALDAADHPFLLATKMEAENCWG
jgi:hypothetical protein